MKRPLYLLLIASLALQSFANDSIVGLRTLGLEKPLGIESTPAFSWKIESSRRGYRQSAYEITVTDSHGVTLWKSGKVASSRQTDVPYEGKPLKSRSAYTWTITAFDQNDTPSVTAVSSFETGILTQEEWKDAKWIAPKKSPYNAIVEITPNNKGTVKSRYVRLNVTASGPHAASDPNNAFVQIAEMEIYDKEGNNRARNATFTATNSWELTNHGWSIKYINDGVIKGGTNGFTTTQNNSATTIVADLGDTYEIARVILYPRQDVSAVNDATSAANFPSTYTLELGTTLTNYTKQFKAIKANPPSFDANNNVPYIGRNFTTPKGKTVSQARLYASAIGVFTMRLNGKPVTQNVLEPGETQYDKHVLYNTYDVTPLIASGKNTILAQVAGGIANMSSMSDRFVKHELASDEATTSLRAMLYITYSDGTTQCVNTDSQWVFHKSPTTGSNWYGGEDYDARLAIKDLFTTGYDLGAWERCEVVSPSFVAPSVSPNRHNIGLMRAKEYEPLRIVETWPAVSVTKNAKGNYLVDFGQNFAGTYSFCLKAKKGTTITIYDSELQADSACKFEYMYEASGTSNKTLDRYTFRGDKQGETWGPEFMYHGFRYLEISGLDEAPSPSSFTAKRIRSNMASVSHFTTSNTLLNDIHRICYNGIQSQLYNTVTDCPHREKLGWLDVPNMMYQSLCYNFDIKSLLNKVVMDAFDAQGTNGYVPSTVPHFMRAYDDDLNWGGASITIPWRNYKQYGDMTLMRRYYGEMKKLIAYYGTLTQDNIVRNDYSVLSDWGQETSGLEHHTSSSFTLTCAYYYLLGAMTEMATTLGHTEDADAWKQTAADVKDAFNKRFFKDGVYEYGNQANYGMALYYGLVDEADIPHVAKALAEAVESSQYSVKTGEIGLRPTLMSLANNGYNDIVYKMVNKTTYPSYGFWVAQGATTSLEYWDMSLSQNHCMMDHIEEWFFSCLGGICNTGEAYETIQIHPWIPADMTSADIFVVTPRGKVRMAWSRTEKTTTYDINVPAGCVADVVLPVMESKKLYEDGKEIGGIASIGNLTYSDTSAHFTLGSGNYSFTMNGSTLTDEHITEAQNR